MSKYHIKLTEDQITLLETMGTKIESSGGHTYFLPMVFYRRGDIWEVQHLMDAPEYVKKELSLYYDMEKEAKQNIREVGGGED